MAKSLSDILVRRGLVAPREIEALNRKARQSRRDLFELLLEEGVADDEVTNAKGEWLHIPVRKVSQKISFDILREVPEQTAKYYKFVPLARKGDVVDIGMVNPEDTKAKEALRFLASRQGRTFEAYLISPSDLEKVISGYKGFTGEVSKALGEIEGDIESAGVKITQTKVREEDVGDEAPISKIVAVVIKHAIEGKASDIHIEPSDERLRVRFRVDGVLYSSLWLPMDVHSAIVSRVKILSNLKIDESRLPQDGRFRATVDGRDIDFRISTFPTSQGEKLVMRILDPAIGIQDLESLGVIGRNLTVLQRAIEKPFGMILITGPTGSGKTTTLYAILQILNKEGVNIVSLEDPVEYYIKGVNQSQVNPDIGYGFAEGLRHILRQDPDIIMVGEIRDKETATLAVHAALTGHLVLATLHTNNSVGVIPRLIDMGVDPFLIPSTVILAIAQRLVRRLCPDSAEKVKPSPAMLEIISSEVSRLPENIAKPDLTNMQVLKSGPSADCPLGTRGRIGIFEMLEMTKELEEIVLSGPSETKIGQEAKRQGMINMGQDGVLKVLDGVIGMEELLEVV